MCLVGPIRRDVPCHIGQIQVHYIRHTSTQITDWWYIALSSLQCTAACFDASNWRNVFTMQTFVLWDRQSVIISDRSTQEHYETAMTVTFTRRALTLNYAEGDSKQVFVSLAPHSLLPIRLDSIFTYLCSWWQRIEHHTERNEVVLTWKYQFSWHINGLTHRPLAT